MPEKLTRDKLEELLKEACGKAPSEPPSTSLYMNYEGRAVELFVDANAADYSEWIKGEGADICIYREQGTNRVVGCRLPMYYDTLRVFDKKGPLEIEEPQ